MNEKTAWAILAQNCETYNVIAKDFSKTRNYLWPIFLEAKKYIHDGINILDVGCGNGRLLPLFQNYENIFYKGIDVSSVILSEAEACLPAGRNLVNESEHLFFEIGDILNLKEKLEFYDMVFCIAVLNHIPTKNFQLRALENIYKVLKPGGIFFMTNWNLWSLKSRKKSVWFSKKIGGFRECLTYWHDHPLYYHAFTQRELQIMLKKIGFEILRSEYKENNILSIAKK